MTEWSDVLDTWAECELCEEVVPDAWAIDQSWQMVSTDGGETYSLLCPECADMFVEDEEELTETVVHVC